MVKDPEVLIQMLVCYVKKTPLIITIMREHYLPNLEKRRNLEQNVKVKRRRNPKLEGRINLKTKELNLEVEPNLEVKLNKNIERLKNMVVIY